MLSSIRQAHQESGSPDGSSATNETALTLKHVVDSEVPSGRSGHLGSLLANFSQNLVFEPENEKEPVFLNKLPEELLIVIIATLDITSIERFARVCKKARILTLDPGIWMYV